jgi:hypothetical protein
MNNMILREPPTRKQQIELSLEERNQLNTFIDLLIPADKDFPPPSSLHLIDTFLTYLAPGKTDKMSLLVSEKRLRTALRDLNTSADGNFCGVSAERQQTILKHFARREPALFQTLLTLANHSYYSRLATLRYAASLS